MKTCGLCQVSKEESAFYPDSRGGLKSQCKLCYNRNRTAYSAAYRNANREKLREKSNIWQSEHREYLKEYWASYRSAHREECRDRARKWKAGNPDRIKKMEHRAYIKRRTKADYKQMAAAHKAVAQALRKGFLERLDCHICGSKESEAHHYKGYELKHWFDVQWLCREHHVEAHRK